MGTVVRRYSTTKGGAAQRTDAHLERIPSYLSPPFLPATRTKVRRNMPRHSSRHVRRAEAADTCTGLLLLPSLRSCRKDQRYDPDGVAGHTALYSLSRSLEGLGFALFLLPLFPLPLLGAIVAILQD